MYEGTIGEDEVQVPMTAYEKSTSSTYTHQKNTVETWINSGIAAQEDTTLDTDLWVMDNVAFEQYATSFQKSKMKKIVFGK